MLLENEIRNNTRRVGSVMMRSSFVERDRTYIRLAGRWSDLQFFPMVRAPSGMVALKRLRLAVPYPYILSHNLHSCKKYLVLITQ